MAGIAARLEGGKREATIRALPDRTGAQPLSYSQWRVWFLDRLVPGSAAYSIVDARLLSGRLDYPAAEAAIGRILLADADGPEPIRLHMHCPDGDLDAGVVLAETLQLVRARVIAVASGSIGGPVVAAYAAARTRQAHPNARFAFTEPRTAFHGRGSRIAAELELQAQQLRFLQETIGAATGLDPADVAADMQASRIVTADQALRLGLVHEIVTRDTA